MPDSLRSRLTYQPQELRFGTSGRRGEVVHLTQLEIYINAYAEVRYLQSLPLTDGGILASDVFPFAFDLRPSSTSLVENGRGEIAQAIVQAIRDAGMTPMNLGRIPTPALTYYAVSRAKGSIMVTGSHIPFDRNGYKLNTSAGELLKQHEEPINRAVQTFRELVYSEPFHASPFDQHGMLKTGHTDLPAESPEAETFYIKRYLDFFSGLSLRGKRIVVYQHSAIGRDMLADLLSRFDADVIPMGRSETFVPIDTENIDAEQLAVIQTLADAAAAKHGVIDAVVSTDGDSDRPLILGVDNGKVRFFPGDLVGMVVAQYLGVDAVAVPISCNDAIDRSALAPVLEPKTRIGSPHVIAAMNEAASRGRKAICGWEANGGFLVGSDIERSGRMLKKLATRDAFLPILAVLFAAAEKKVSLSQLFSELPNRFSRAALLRRFPRAVGVEIVEQFTPRAERTLEDIKSRLSTFFNAGTGFGPIASIDYTDGVRMRFENGDIAHVRPSGNADELRIYAVSDTLARAEEIVARGIAEPDGILRQIEHAVCHMS